MTHPDNGTRVTDWKATAHTGALQVREFAREQEPAAALILDLHCPPEHRDWFEYAVECCSFLATRLARDGARIGFRTHNYAARVPVDADLYAILKYLALVQPASGPLPAPDPHDNAIPIVFTTRPAEVEPAGWLGVRVLHPALRPVPARARS